MFFSNMVARLGNKEKQKEGAGVFATLQNQKTGSLG